MARRFLRYGRGFDRMRSAKTREPSRQARWGLGGSTTVCRDLPGTPEEPGKITTVATKLVVQRELVELRQKHGTPAPRAVIHRRDVGINDQEARRQTPGLLVIIVEREPELLEVVATLALPSGFTAAVLSVTCHNDRL